MSARILEPGVIDLMTDKYQTDARVVSLLSQTCKTFRDSFPTTYAMHDIADWLVWNQELSRCEINLNGDDAFDWAQVSRTRRTRTWLIHARCRRNSVNTFEHLGVIRVGKCSAILTIVGESRDTMHKDSFYGVQSLETLKTCLLSHAILCHELPENLPRLPPTVVHRHRDSVPWTFMRAFYVWRASLPGYETWNGGRNHENDEDDEVDMTCKVIYFA
jgi:hypothetical protein